MARESMSFSMGKTAKSDLVAGPDGEPRCRWGASSAEYVAYHDSEWGRPVRDDRGLYERLCLEAFQSGLSWLTILRKREAFRSAFAGFEIERCVPVDVPMADPTSEVELGGAVPEAAPVAEPASANGDVWGADPCPVE